MKVAILLCVMCVVVGTFAQGPGRSGASGAAAAGGGSSDAMRAMMMSRMLSGRGGAGGGRRLAQMLLIRGALEPMEYMMCQHNPMMCMMMMN